MLLRAAVEQTTEQADKNHHFYHSEQLHAFSEFKSVLKKLKEGRKITCTRIECKTCM